jgi:hypothetical protein
MIYDRFTCPEPDLNPPAEEEDTRPRCRCCGELNQLVYKSGSTVIGCDRCIVALSTDEPRYIDCPCCKSEAERVYMDRSSGQIVGCNSCVTVEDISDG